jgi:hypothetical protein
MHCLRFSASNKHEKEPLTVPNHNDVLRVLRLGDFDFGRSLWGYDLWKGCVLTTLRFWTKGR